MSVFRRRWPYETPRRNVILDPPAATPDPLQVNVPRAAYWRLLDLVTYYRTRRNTILDPAAATDPLQVKVPRAAYHRVGDMVAVYRPRRLNLPPSSVASTATPVIVLPNGAATSTAIPTGILYSVVDVYYGNAKQATLQILGGTVQMSEASAVRRTCNIEVVDHDLAPRDMADLLAPNGVELRIRSGIDSDINPVGVFRVMTTEAVTSGSAVTVRLSGSDRSSAVSAAGWPAPFAPNPGTPIHQTISAILSDRAPWLPQLITPSNYATPAGLVFGMQATDDPWKDCQTLAASAGMVLFIDSMGIARLQPAVPDPDNVKAYFVYGGNLLHALSRKLDASKTYNGVNVIGGAPGTPTVTAMVWDTDPNSRTYYLGPFGQRPTTFNSTLITDPVQAVAVGQAQLAQYLGVLESLHAAVKPNSALEGGDICIVGHPKARTDGLYVVSGFTLPLTAGGGAMGLDFRARRLL